MHLSQSALSKIDEYQSQLIVVDNWLKFAGVFRV